MWSFPAHKQACVLDFKLLGVTLSNLGGEIIHKEVCPQFMEGAKVWLDKNIDIEDALVVCCFPSVGMVSSVVAHFLIDHLNLEFVGELHILNSQLFA